MVVAIRSVPDGEELGVWYIGCTGGAYYGAQEQQTEYNQSDVAAAAYVDVFPLPSCAGVDHQHSEDGTEEHDPDDVTEVHFEGVKVEA